MPAPACTEALPSALDDQRADRDRRVEVAGEVDVADDSGVRAAFRRLELVDDLHRPHLRRAGDRPGGKRRPQHVDWSPALEQLAGDLRGEVHDVAVALEGHQLVDLLGAEAHDPADVVAGQVDEHDVLGQLLRVLDSSASSRRSSSSVEPRRRVPAIGREITRPSSSWTIGSGDGADDRHASLAEEEHVRARVHLAEHAVHVERVAAEVEIEALRQHDLEGVARADVLLGDFDGLAVLLRGGATANHALGQRRVERRRRRRAAPGRCAPGRAGARPGVPAARR